MLTIRTCASRRNRATKDQLPPFSIPPSTVNDGITDRGTTHNVAARTSRLADVRSGDHARLRMKNLATKPSREIYCTKPRTLISICVVK